MNIKPAIVERFRGINNRLPEDRLDKPASKGAGVFVRDATNVDLTEAGTFQRRPGFVRVVEAANCRSMFEIPGGFMYAAGAELWRFNGTSDKVADLASPGADVAYADTPLGIAWSDGFSLNLIAAGASRLMHPRAPNPLPIASATAGGVLLAGNYGVAFATVMPDGRRSELSYPQNVAVSDGGAITIAATGHAEAIAVFVTTRDGSILYREANIPVGASSAVIPLIRADREAMNYEVMAPLPPGSILGYHHGRLLSVVDTILFHSRAYDLGVHRPAFDFTPFPDAITLVAPVEAGVFVATTEKTYFLAGADIAVAQAVERQPFGAVAGTLAYERNRKTAMWFTPRGAVRAAADGSMELLQDRDIVFSPAQSGAAMVREENGLRSFVAALATTGQPAGALFGSYIDAEVIN